MNYRLTLSGDQDICLRVLSHASNLGLQLVEFTSAPPDYSDFNVFISYRRADSTDIAGRIYDHLVWTFGKFSVFLDVESIPAGDSWQPILEEQASSCTMMLAVIGPDWVTSKDEEGNQRLFQDDDFVRLELSIALAREDVPVVPILIKGAKLPTLDQLPENIQSLAGRQSTELRSGVHFRNDVRSLVAKVRERFDLLNTP